MRSWRFHGWPARAVFALALLLLATLPAGAALLKPGHRVLAQRIPCNGYVSLCDRRFDEVVFAATHNSMASTEAGFQLPSQQYGITRQLDDGIRMLLIDTHHWESSADIQRVIAKLPADKQAAFTATLKEPAVPPRGVFLCHVFCGAGSTPLVDGLTLVRQFMDTHPHEVLGIFFEDYVTPTETAAAFVRSGLIRYVYTHEPGDEWPTLGEMVANNQRLVVFSEHKGPPPDWYAYGWNEVQDTSYNVGSADRFSCALNRGNASAPLFLLNNWVARAEPSRTDAREVNAYAFLLSRARQCAAQRGRIPNFIAVNFYDQGDLLSVVDALNGTLPPR